MSAKPIMLCGWAVAPRRKGYRMVNLGTECRFQESRPWQDAPAHRRCAGCGQTLDVVASVEAPPAKWRHAAELHRRGLPWRSVAVILGCSTSYAAHIGRLAEEMLADIERACEMGAPWLKWR